MFPDSKSTLIFFVNGKKVVEDNADPEWTLLYYLRRKLHLCGVKLGCGEGGCGACTVMVSKYNRKKKRIIHMAVNACLYPICSMHGLAVTTTEGIRGIQSLTKERKFSYTNPVQERIALAHGSQCGFCTPGIVMSMYALLRSLPEAPLMEDIENALHGNLCRCTGYRPILEGFRTFTQTEDNINVCTTINKCNKKRKSNENDQKDFQNEVSTNALSVNGECNIIGCANGNNCCKYKNEETSNLFDSKQFAPYDPLQEPIFPPELQTTSKLDEQLLVFRGKKTVWYRPQQLNDILLLKNKYPEARIVVGNTELGIEMKFKNFCYPILIHPSQVHELLSVEETPLGLKIGAAVTLDEVETSLQKQIKNNFEHTTRIFSAVVEMLHWFAGKQIRNVACIGGNIMTGSPISDLNPIFIAAGCQLEIMSKERGLQTLVMTENFFVGYRKNILKPDEILLSITIPYTNKDEYFFAYKQSKRKADDIAIVNAGMKVELETGSKKVKKIALAFGGMAPTTILAKKTAKILIGREWNDEMLEDAYTYLMEDLPLSPDAPGGVVQYRRSLSLRFYLRVCQLQHGYLSNQCIIQQTFASGADEISNIPFQSSQYVKLSQRNKDITDIVGQPIVHASAFKQATGEAVYCDDIPHLENEAYMTLIKSTNPHAIIISIDTKEAFEKEGVLGIFTAKDIKSGKNKFGPITLDEEVFASEKVVCQGQVIAAVVAENQCLAKEAAKAVKIQYEDLTPRIITIEDAIKEKSFFDGFSHVIQNGDIEKGFQQSEHTISGEVRIGGQEHFYLETMSTLVVPSGEDSEMTVYCTTQNPTETQGMVANVLGIPANRIVCKVKRMGGAFGGKESRSSIVVLPAAIAANKLNRPIRCMLEREEDMVMTGTRHPYLGKYKVGFTKDGKINAYEILMYSNGGNSLELSISVLSRSVFHIDNAYYIPNVKCSAYICKTNLPSNTGFRGFGAPQAMFFAENVIRHIAAYLRKDAIDVAFLNLYKAGNKTHYNQELSHCTLEQCWNKCLEKSDYYKRNLEINEYNNKNRWKKKGLSIVPTKLGIGFAEKFLNQAGALVLVYVDGSVLLTHGGTEMGQGLHTKMIQVASRALGISESYIHISETSTDKVPNTSATATSSSSDFNGMAILNACDKISKRLAPYKEKYPNKDWKSWVEAAYMDRISLSATGFYRAPDINYDPATNTGRLYNYFTYGVACSEVEIDCLTGDHVVKRTDIVMDIGESLNPAIDIGQIEGEFVQGMGLFTLEEVQYSRDGFLLTRGPGTYKIPAFSNAPRQFNVSILGGAPNPRAIYSSKGVGEPSLFLSASVFFGLKEAIIAARIESKIDRYEHFRLDSPATSATIRMSCIDFITNKFPDPNPDSFIPWNVRP